MPRRARTNLKGNFFHVVVQGLNKEYIFDKENYICKYKKCMFEKLNKTDITILAYCIMNNHVHILIYCDEINKLSKYMQFLNTTYSNFYNKMQKRVGYVFKDRFYTQQIFDRKQLLNCLVYIHNNPVKAKICQNMSDYKYSSYNEFIDKKYIITEESIRLLFEDEENYINNFYRIHRNYKEEFEIFDIKEIKIENFIKDIEQNNKIEIKNLKKDKKALEKVIKEARKLTNVTLQELGILLGISKSTVANYDKK